MMPTLSTHPAFTLLRKHTISALNIDVYEYEHSVTGASHYHFASDNSENVFLVGFRTVPMDHKGVAHILEHTALCGSEKYPVRDPFFMMIRRSLNTFMNAFTSNDWTAYPFASTNRKDFFNLLDVYLDATFFSRLDELDFLQEGHRLEFEEATNSESPLVYKGVVFNEMKGAMSSISSTLWQTLCKHLFSNTTYHFNSGGDPEHITDLSYQELLDFYQTHYHPSNAMFATFGDIAPADIQAVMHDNALARFAKSDKEIGVGRENRLLSPLKVSEYYALDSQDSEKQSHHVIGWLLGQNTCLQDVMEAQLLSYVLLENSACPLQNLLETTKLGSAPSPLCGLEDAYHELIFCCGIQGADDSDTQNTAALFEKEVFATLQEVAENGVSLKRLEAIVHQLELSQREITGDGYPFGLQIILNGLPSVTHRGDPIELLDLDPVLEQIRQNIQDPNYIKGLVKRLLIDNQHRISLEMRPDQNLSEKRKQAESAKLAQIKQGLSESDAQNIISQAQALAERQSQEDNGDILPKVTLQDIPKETHYLEAKTTKDGKLESYNYQQGTNGLVYQQLIFALPDIDQALLKLLPLYAQCLTELGLGAQSFEDVQHRQSEEVGSIHAFPMLRGSLESEQEVHAYLALSAKALSRNTEAMGQLLLDTISSIRFDETDRIKDMLSQQRLRKQNSITGAGHSYAMMSAASQYSPLAQLNETLGGLSGIQATQALDDACKDEQSLQHLSEQLQALHQCIITGELKLLNIAETEHIEELEALSASYKVLAAHTSNTTFKLPHTRQASNIAWLCNSQVNFCAKAYPTVTAAHPDAPALTILGDFLRNGFLHTAIREKGGAYGSGASQDNSIAAFKFYSYRDPRITGTLDDFDAAIGWMLETDHKAESLEQAILGVVSSIDKPSSPAGEAKQACHNLLFGRDKAQQQAFRQAIINTTLDDLVRVTQTYLKDKPASLGIVSHEGERETLEALAKTQSLSIKQLA